MPTQKDAGKAFEFALITEAEKLLSAICKVTLLKDASYASSKASFQLYNSPEQLRYTQGAVAALTHICQLEPRLAAPSSKSDILELQLMPDSAGQQGDVRDILFIRSNQNWEIGISAKNNHMAVKHSRLSDTLDFGSVWLGVNCAPKYFTSIAPVFQKLRTLKSQQAKWSSMQNKATTVYRPILDAFKGELLSLHKNNSNIPQTLVRYLLGNRDFYKVIRRKSKVEILGFNLQGTLNKAAKGRNPNTVSKLKYPTQIIRFDYKPNSNNTLLLVCDQGWTISFRIHNAETLVVPSLKFDINLVGTPNVYSHHISY